MTKKIAVSKNNARFIKTYPVSENWLYYNYKQFVAIGDLTILNTVECDTNVDAFSLWKVKLFRKIEKLTFRSCEEFENFRRYINVNIFKIVVNI
jgi:hypothetical protein